MSGSPDERRSGAEAHFHPCPTDPGCPYCQGDRSGQRYDWNFVGQAYCISLQSRPERAARAAAHFHAMGLCRHVTFYRPLRHPTRIVAGIWESHRAIALNALAEARSPVLIFEDDVLFTGRATPATIARIGTELAALPPDWEIYFLGHWPFWAWFLTRRTLRTSSACAHAYFAGRPLLQWLADHPFESRKELPRRAIAGKGIDAYYAKRPATYALFPMIAIQDGSPSDHFAHARAKNSRKLHHLMVQPAWFESVFSRLPLIFEAIMILPAAAVGLLRWAVRRSRR